MGDIQKLVIDGKSYVLLSEDDYEDLIDGLQADAIMARVDAGEEPGLSRSCRRRRTAKILFGLSAVSEDDDDRTCGCRPAFPSLIVRHRNRQETRSVAVLLRIARALKVDLDDLVVEVEPD